MSRAHAARRAASAARHASVSFASSGHGAHRSSERVRRYAARARADDAPEALVREAREDVRAQRASARSAARDVTFEDEVLPALAAFYAERGHLNVPRAYVVPSDAKGAMAGTKLGLRVDRMRQRGDFVRGDATRLAALDAIGAATGETFAWDSEDWVFYKQVIPSLRYYIKAHDKNNIPVGYETPKEEEAYSAANKLKPYNRGYALGQRVNDIRAKGTFIDGRPDRFDALHGVEFVWDDEEFYFRQKVVTGLLVFRRSRGHLHVPADFVFGETIQDAWRPSKVQERFPLIVMPHLRGFELGAAVAQIRHLRFRDRDPQLAKARIKHLDKIGFIWDLRAWHFEKVFLPTLRWFVTKHGHAAVGKSLTIYHSAVAKDGAPTEAIGRDFGKMFTRFIETLDFSSGWSVADRARACERTLHVITSSLRRAQNRATHRHSGGDGDASPVVTEKQKKRTDAIIERLSDFDAIRDAEQPIADDRNRDDDEDNDDDDELI